MALYMEGQDGKVYRIFPDGWREVLDQAEADAARSRFPWKPEAQRTADRWQALEAHVSGD